jgi:hypothetical protein
MKPEADYRGAMGLIRGTFLLSNPTRPDLAPLEVSALADTRRTVPYVGPVEVRFRNRRCFTGAMLLGNEVLRPQLQSVDVNPESPNIPLSVAK